MNANYNKYPYPFNLLKELDNVDYLHISDVDLMRITRGYGYLFRELFTYVLNTFLTSGTIKMIELYYEEHNSISSIAQRYHTIDSEIEKKLTDTKRAITNNSSFLRLIECSTITGFIAKEISEKSFTEPRLVKEMEYKRGKKEGFDEGYKKGRSDLIEEINNADIKFTSDTQKNEDIYKLKYSEEEMKVLRTPIEELGLSSRAANCISRSHSCINLYELACIKPEDLIRTRNLGQISYQEIVKMLKSKGLNTVEYEKYIIAPKMK